MRTVERYICEICEHVWAKESEAAECEAQGILDMKRGVKPEVGDIVECGTPYGWHTKRDTVWARKFIQDREKGRACGVDFADGGDTWYQRIFVVSAITMRHHEKIYHLYCPEPPQEPETVYTCWGHMPMQFAELSAERADWVEQNEEVWRGKTSGSLT